MFKNLKNICLLSIVSTGCLFGEDSYEELLFPEWRQKFIIEEILYREKTDLQDLIIFQHGVFGKVLALDGVIQLTEKDEYIYSEMLAHVPLMAHKNPKKVLIIGGGDGCIMREVLKHPSIDHVDLVEIDPSVIELSKEHFPNLCLDAFNDKKSSIIIQDAFVFLQNTENSYDVIICDSTDPIGPAAVLFTEEFYKLCYDHLNDNGIFVNQNGVPFLQSECFVNTYKIRDAIFDSTTYYYAAVPSYVGGLMAMGFSTKGNPIENEKLIEQRSEALAVSYYTPAIHQAAFKTPKMLLELLH